MLIVIHIAILALLDIDISNPTHLATCITVYVQSVSVRHSAKWFLLDLTADDWERLNLPIFQTFV